jgi:small multidrug resistance family-3 protein
VWAKPVQIAPALFLGVSMSNFAILAVLVLAAALESGGDALARFGLQAQAMPLRAGFFASAALVLFVYGVTVNLPPWDFGKLLGVYVALFFVVAQIINLFAFGMKPSLPIYCGGALIVAGGMLMTFWKA